MTYKLANTSQPADPYYGAVKLLLHGDGADGSTEIFDSSLNPKTVTAVGNAQISTTESKFNGSSLKFDGSGDYVATPDSEDFYLPGDFTIEAWVYPTSSTGIHIIVAQWREQGGSDRNFSIRSDDGIFYMNRAGTNRSVSLGAFSLNQWTHFAISVENGTCYGFINGVLQDSNSNFTAAANNSTEPLGIGAYGNGDYVFEGYIDEFRITKGVARYTSNFTPPTQPFFGAINPDQDRYFYATSLLLKGDGTNGSTNIVDSSDESNTITAAGNAQISTAQSKFGGSSLGFAAGYYTTPYSQDLFDWWTTPFTVEAWVYVTNFATTEYNFLPIMIGNMNPTSGTNYWSFGVNRDARVRFFWFTGTSQSVFSATNVVSLSTWTHIAMTHESGTVRLFADGALVASTSSLGNPTSSASTPLSIGGFNNTSMQDIFVDDLRITKGVARYTSNFTPPGSLPTY